MKPSVDVESLKTDKEVEDAFQEVRQAYYDEFKDYLSEEEVAVLAQLLANIDMWGRSYPVATLKKIKALLAKATAKRKESRRQKLKRNFEE